MREVVDILRATRSRILRKWGKHSYHSCLVGAVNEIAGYSVDCFPEPSIVQKALEALIKELPQGTHPTLIWFNDAHKTTRADVLALIDRAIAAQQPKTDITPLKKLLEVPVERELAIAEGE